MKICWGKLNSERVWHFQRNCLMNEIMLNCWSYVNAALKYFDNNHPKNLSIVIGCARESKQQTTQTGKASLMESISYDIPFCFTIFIVYQPACGAWQAQESSITFSASIPFNNFTAKESPAAAATSIWCPSGCLLTTRACSLGPAECCPAPPRPAARRRQPAAACTCQHPLVQCSYCLLRRRTRQPSTCHKCATTTFPVQQQLQLQAQ